jgi:hypothetical protein
VVDARRRDALAPGIVDLLVEAADGAVWANSNGNGLARIDPATLAMTRYDDADGLRSADIGQIGFAAGWRLAGGACRRRGSAGSAIASLCSRCGAPAQRVLAFAFADDGTLWLHAIGALLHFGYAHGALVPLGRTDAPAAGRA